MWKHFIQSLGVSWFFIIDLNLYPPDQLLSVGYFGEFRLSHEEFRAQSTSLNNEAKIGEALAKSMTIHCFSEHMVVYFDRAILKSTSIFEENQISLDESDKSCAPTKKASNKTHFVLATLYSLCKTKETLTSDAVVYQNQVTFRLHSAVENSAADKILAQSSLSSSTSTTSSLNTNQGFAKGTQEFFCPLYLKKRVLPSSSALNNRRPGNQRQNVNENNESHSFIVQENETSLLYTARSVIDLNSNSNYTFRLQLYDSESTSPSATNNPWIKFPHEVKVRQRIYAQISLNQPNYQDNDLKALAKDCYFNTKSDPNAEPRHMLLVSGCPAMNTVLLHHNRTSSSSATRFSFVAGFVFDDKNYMYLFFHCKVAVCSKQGGRENDRIEKCPSSTYCSESTVGESNIVVNPIHSYVSSGPLRLVISDSADVGSSYSMNSDSRRVQEPSVSLNLANSVSNSCPPCPSVLTEAAGTENSQISQRIIIKGMDTVTVLGVAMASFMVGVLLMGGLCYVHKITDPKKIPDNRRKADRDLSSLDICTSEPTATTPMTQTTLASKLSLPCCIEGECGDDAKRVPAASGSDDECRKKFLQRYD